MEIYKKGKIVSTGGNYIIFETNNIGEIIYVPDINKYKKNEDTQLFIFHYKNEYINTTYGFYTHHERMMFQDLINVSGVGPKTALSLLSNGKEQLINVIARQDVASICKYPFLGVKTAKQIIFELSEKYQKQTSTKSMTQYKSLSELKNTLKTLGFRKHQIDFAIKNTTSFDNIEKMLENSIKVISNAKFS